MNEHALRIMGLHTKIEKNKSLSKKMKVFAGVCLFFSFCYCFGSASIGFLNIGQVLLTNLVWIVSILLLVGIYLKDAQCIKSNKAIEFEIYRLEVEDLNSKKEVARIIGNQLPDYVYDRQINVPDETISLPSVYYGILIAIDIIIRIYLFVNHVV